MKLRALTTAMLCASVGACSFDLTKVEDTDPEVMETPGSFYLSITAAVGESLDMRAVFEPGTGTDGLPRPIANDTLRIDGEPFAPTAGQATPGSPSARNYLILTPLTSPASFQLETPRLAGEPEPGAIDVSVPGIAPIDTIIVTSGQPIEVEITGLMRRDSLAYWSWAMVLNADDGASQVSVVRSGALPGVLRFPAELLPDEFERGHIGVNAYSYYEIAVANRKYPIRVQRQLAANIPFRRMP